jgi:hypothetical protein
LTLVLACCSYYVCFRASEAPSIRYVGVQSESKDAHRLITIIVVVVIQVMTRFKLGTVTWAIDEIYPQHYTCALIQRSARSFH